MAKLVPFILCLVVLIGIGVSGFYVGSAFTVNNSNKTNDTSSNLSDIDNQITDLQSQVSELMQTLKSEREKITQLNAEKTELESNMAQVTADKVEALKKITELNTELKTANENIQKLTAERTKLTSNNTSMYRFIEMLPTYDATVAEQKSEMQSLLLVLNTNYASSGNSIFDNLILKINEYKTQIKTLQDNATADKKDLQDQIDALTTKINKIITSYRNCLMYISKTDSATGYADADALALYNDGIVYLMAYVTPLEADISPNSVQYIQTTFQKLKDLYSEIATLTADKGSLQQQIDTVTEQKNSYKTMYDNMSKTLEEKEKRISDLLIEKADLQTQVSNLTTQTTNLQKQVNALTTDKTTLNTQITTLQKQITDLQSQITTLTSDYGFVYKAVTINDSTYRFIFNNKIYIFNTASVYQNTTPMSVSISSDGENWETTNLTFNDDSKIYRDKNYKIYYKIILLNNIFFLYTKETNRYYTSTDGVNFIGIYQFTASVSAEWTLEYYKGVYIAYRSNTTSYSTDGKNWTKNSDLSFSVNYGCKIFGDNGDLILTESISAGNDLSTKKMAYTSDGKTWTEGVMQDRADVVAYANNYVKLKALESTTDIITVGNIKYYAKSGKIYKLENSSEIGELVFDTGINYLNYLNFYNGLFIAFKGGQYNASACSFYLGSDITKLKEYNLPYHGFADSVICFNGKLIIGEYYGEGVAIFDLVKNLR